MIDLNRLVSAPQSQQNERYSKRSATAKRGQIQKCKDIKQHTRRPTPQNYQNRSAQNDLFMKRQMIMSENQQNLDRSLQPLQQHSFLSSNFHDQEIFQKNQIFNQNQYHHRENSSHSFHNIASNPNPMNSNNSNQISKFNTQYMHQPQMSHIDKEQQNFQQNYLRHDSMNNSLERIATQANSYRLMQNQTAATTHHKIDVESSMQNVHIIPNSQSTLGNPIGSARKQNEQQQEVETTKKLEKLIKDMLLKTGDKNPLKDVQQNQAPFVGCQSTVSGANTSIVCPSESTNLNKFLDIQINKNKSSYGIGDPISVISYRPDTSSQDAEGALDDINASENQNAQQETWLLECQQRDLETLQQIERNKELIQKRINQRFQVLRSISTAKNRTSILTGGSSQIGQFQRNKTPSDANSSIINHNISIQPQNQHIQDYALINAHNVVKGHNRYLSANYHTSVGQIGGGIISGTTPITHHRSIYPSGLVSARNVNNNLEQVQAGLPQTSYRQQQAVVYSNMLGSVMHQQQMSQMIAMHQKQMSVGGGHIMLKNMTAPPGITNQVKKVKRINKQAVILNNNTLGSSSLLQNNLVSSGTNLAQKNSPLNQLQNFSAKKVKKIHKKKVVSQMNASYLLSQENQQTIISSEHNNGDISRRINSNSVEPSVWRRPLVNNQNLRQRTGRTPSQFMRPQSSGMRGGSQRNRQVYQNFINVRTISPENQHAQLENFTGGYIKQENGLLSNRLPNNPNKLLEDAQFNQDQGISKSLVPMKPNVSGMISSGYSSNVPYPHSNNFKHQMSNQTLTTDADQVLLHSYRPPHLNRFQGDNQSSNTHAYALATNRTIVESNLLSNQTLTDDDCFNTNREYIEQLNNPRQNIMKTYQKVSDNLPEPHRPFIQNFQGSEFTKNTELQQPSIFARQSMITNLLNVLPQGNKDTNIEERKNISIAQLNLNEISQNDNQGNQTARNFTQRPLSQRFQPYESQQSEQMQMTLFQQNPLPQLQLTNHNQESKTSAAFMIVDDADDQEVYIGQSPACNQQSSVFAKNSRTNKELIQQNSQINENSSQRVPTVMQINSNLPPSRTAFKLHLQSPDNLMQYSSNLKTSIKDLSEDHCKIQYSYEQSQFDQQELGGAYSNIGGTPIHKSTEGIIMYQSRKNNLGHQNIPCQRRSNNPNAEHSDDEVEIRRGLESSEIGGSLLFDQRDPQLNRQSTHSLLGRTARALSTRRQRPNQAAAKEDQYERLNNNQNEEEFVLSQSDQIVQKVGGSSYESYLKNADNNIKM